LLHTEDTGTALLGKVCIDQFILSNIPENLNLQYHLMSFFFDLSNTFGLKTNFGALSEKIYLKIIKINQLLNASQ